MSYRLDLIGADGKSATETHELAEATGIGVHIRDDDKETWIPWERIQVVSITNLDGEVRQPEQQVALPRLASRRAR